ncbi:glycoside hydrolase superfamily [Coniella lustricola]|uniref:Probable glucan endo-1,3-beta-glucosidase eglC n=1 Tax=Coniella lustricola TaxID=2025994 RepID=A0A2T2ZTU9_9PEZI|nr:glycoside hydrolase superfamily [Coniella lustricola]
MHGSAAFFAALAASPAAAAYVGFNYGSTFTTGAAKAQSDFEAEFTTAQSLISAPTVFNSARLYTMIQAGTTNTPISALPAAVSTQTTLLLGLWASGGDAGFANELAALQSAIAAYGTSLSSLVAGISVGSEDLYRISPTGIAAGSNPGASPDTLVGYISQVRSALANTAWSSVPVGHVDTWTAWVNASNDAVTSASDFIGVDAYPYFQNTMSNAISDGQSLFSSAIQQTQAAVGSKPIWITETGWPVSGPTENLAVPSIENAQTYWDTVGCPLFGTTNVWWYTLQDAAPDTPSPSFGIVGSTLTSTPLYDLSCNASSSSTSAASSGSGSASASGTIPLASATESASPTGADSGSPGISAGIGGNSGATGNSTATSGASSPSGTSGSSSSATGSGSGSSSSGSSGSGSSGSGSSGSGSSGSGSGGSATGNSATPSSTVVTTNTAASTGVFTLSAVSAILLGLAMLL